MYVTQELKATGKVIFIKLVSVTFLRLFWSYRKGLKNRFKKYLKSITKFKK